MGNNSGNGFGFSIGGSGGGGGTVTSLTTTGTSGASTLTAGTLNIPVYANDNIANADLTLDGDHVTDVGSNTLTIDSGAVNIAQFNGTSNKIIFGPSGDDYTFPDERPTTAGDVLAAADTSGNLEWASQTNTNIANTDLTSTGASRLFTLANGGTLTFQTFAGSDLLTFHNPTRLVRIGPASSYYSLPLQRSGTNTVMIAEDTTGALTFSTLVGQKGTLTMTFSGDDSSWAAGSYLFFKKQGGTMVESTNLNVGMSNAIAMEGWISDGIITPNSFKLQANWDTLEGNTASLGFVFCDYTGQTQFVGTAETDDLAEGLTRSGTFAQTQGTVRANMIADGTVTSGNFITPVLKNTGLAAITNCSFVLTIFFDSSIEPTP
jgi:hypothetical protein